MTLKVVTAAAYQPVALAEARLWLRSDDDDTTQDDLIELLIAAMAEYAENLTGRAFVQRTLRLTLAGWPCVQTEGYVGAGIVLPQAPLSEVLTVKYYDQDGVQQTLAADQYVVHSDREPALIVPAWQVTWPSTRALINAVEVNYIAGYAPVGSPVGEAEHQAGQPASVKLWMHARLATLYANREQLVASNLVKIPPAFADGLLDSLVLGERVV